MKKGIILVRDTALVEYIQKNFPDWLVCVTNEPGATVSCYPIPNL